MFASHPCPSLVADLHDKFNFPAYKSWALTHYILMVIQTGIWVQNTKEHEIVFLKFWNIFVTCGHFLVEEESAAKLSLLKDDG